MKGYIKKLSVLLILTAAVLPLSAETDCPAVDLTLTIGVLDQAVKAGEPLPEAGTPVIINGTVISRKVIDAEENTFSGELVLASGEWDDEDNIIVSECVVMLQGPEFFETIPVRRSRTANPKEIILNSELLVYGFFAGTVYTPEGPAPLIQAAGIRTLK